MELSGNLGDFGLPDIVQLVAFGRKTGALQVEDGRGGASLYFEDGNVVHAEHRGEEGERAAYSLLGIQDGHFRFQSEIAAPGRTLSMDPTNLILEAARQLDEARRRRSPDPATAENGPGSRPPEKPSPGKVKDEIRALLLRRFGKDAARLTEAVDRCGDSENALVDLAYRVEKYVHVFLDPRASRALGAEIRALVSGPAH